MGNCINLILATLICLTFDQAFAIFGDSTFLKQGGNPAVCRYIIRNSDQSVAICSGVLIDSQYLISAKHCLENGSVPELVQCGQQKVIEGSLDFILSSSGNKIARNGIEFKESFRVINLYPHKELDQIILKLERPSTIKPISLTTISSHVFDSCELSGFGLNNMIYAGIQNSAKLNSLPRLINNSVSNHLFFPSNVETEFEPGSKGAREFIKKANVSKVTGAGIAPGDSGSGLICKTNRGKLGVVAISSNFQIGRMFASPKREGSSPDPSKMQLFYVWQDNLSPVDLDWAQRIVK
jgi:secreted trypsin-like serine protease